MTNKNKPPEIRISQARKKLLASYADAAGCLYGALSLSEFIEVFNSYEFDETNENEANLALQRYAKANPDEVEYSLYRDLIVGPTLHPDSFEDDIENIKALRMEQKSKPRYYPDKDDFLKFADAIYIDPIKPYDDLKAYILKNKLCSDNGLDGVDGDLLDLHEMIQNRVDPTGLIQYFLDRGYPLRDVDKINAFMQVVMAAHNNTRMFENNGFTPNELGKILESQHPKEPIIHQPKKVGRNDTCPCGSGKKFKRCCALIEISGAAQLSHDERRLFYETWYKLLDYANQKLSVVKYKFSLKYPDHHDETLLHKIRERLWEKPEIISEFIFDPERLHKLNNEEINLMHSWEKNHVKGQFTLIKYEPDYAVFMQMEQGKEFKLYAVKGMTTSIAEAMHRMLPVMLETVLLPFGDKIIYDSFMASHAIEYGDGVMKMFEDEYAKSIKAYGIINKL